MKDRNKSELTHEVTSAVAAWMDERGFKPVETEVYVERGWVADLAGVIVPTQTELIDLKLLRPRPTWKRPTDEHAAWKAEYDAIDRTMTALVEVKTSRSDFVGDRKWKLPIPTDLAFLAVPSGMVKEEEWPTGWGILSYSNGSVRRLRTPTPTVTTISQQFSVVLEIAVRRDHHTRYARLREQQRERRISDAEAKSIRRASDIARAFLQIARAEHNSVEEVLGRNNIKNLGGFVMEQLENLWGVAQVETDTPQLIESIAQ
jgi:hypothetical protein